MSPRLSRAEWLALTIGLSIAAGFFVHQWRYPSSLYDAAQYAEMGRSIAAHGPFSRFTDSQVRTYGYPLFLSAIVLIASALHLPFVLALFPVQLGLYVLAAVALRRALASWSVPAARVVFCGLLLNYYALLYTPECLTESLSISAAILLAAGWISAHRRHGPLPLLALLSGLAGFSVMIRPANIAAAATAIVGTALIAVRSRFVPRRAMFAAVIVAVCVALPFLPQLRYNVTQFGRWTPLVARDLGKAQQAWGIQDIKYATAMPPTPESAVHYVNPWLAGTTVDEANPLAWYVSHPRRGALTLALHSFNLTDQDLLFTYSHDLDPWYRVPLGLVNHAVVALGLIGLVLLGSAALRTGPGASRDAVMLLALALAGTWALHAWAAVEMRFGALLLCALFPAAGCVLDTLVRSKNMGRALAIALIVAAYVAGALRLSAWVRDQSPLIRAVIANKEQPHAETDGDGDGVPNSRDRCPAIYAATSDGCAIPAPRSGDWSGDGAAQLTFLDRIAARAHVWTFRDGLRASSRDLPIAIEPDWTIVGTSDLSGDGRPDILWQHRQTGDLRLSTGIGTSAAEDQIVMPKVGDRDWHVAGTGDFNGDGQADIVWQHLRTGYVAIWFMKSVDGHAALQSATYVTAAGDAAVAELPWRVMGTMDFDGDGRRDLIMENADTGDLSVARLGTPRMLGLPIVGRLTAGAPGPDWDVHAVADYDGDTRDDLMLQQRSTGQIALWIRHGDGFVPFGAADPAPAGWEAAGPR